MKHCEDCGTILREGGMCGSCDEELHIMTYQSQDTPLQFTEEFLKKAAESNAKLMKRQKEIQKGNY